MGGGGSWGHFSWDCKGPQSPSGPFSALKHWAQSPEIRFQASAVKDICIVFHLYHLKFLVTISIIAQTSPVESLMSASVTCGTYGLLA